MPIDIHNDSPEIALKKLKARENALRRLEAISKLGSWEVDLKTKKSYWSDRSYEIYGYKPGEIEPSLDTFFNAVLPEYVEQAKRLLARMMETKDVSTFHTRIRHTDGHLVDVVINAQVITDEEGNPSKLIGTTQDIMEYVNLQRHSKELLEILEKSSNEIYILDIETFEYLYVNEGAVKKLGYSKKEFARMDVYSINPYLTEEKANKIAKIMKKHGHAINRTIHRCKNGREYHVQSYLQTIRFQNKDAFIIFDTDISSQVELEKREREQAKIVETMSDGVIVTDLQGRVRDANKAAKKILGYETIKNVELLFGQEHKNQIRALMQNIQTCCTGNEECSIDTEVECIQSGGRRIVCDLSVMQLKDSEGKMYGIVWMFEDISHKKQQQLLLQKQAEQLENLAYHDPLTALPNRTLFRDRLSQAISYSKRNDKKFALLFIDLDRFKQINDSLGHQFGDQVLLEVSKRIKSVIRQEDTLARFGGDEFLVIARDISDKEDAQKIAVKILESLQKPFNLLGHDVYTTISIGVSIYPDDSQNAESLIKYADSAMYRAKEEGRNNFRFYVSKMTEDAFEKVVLENALRAAIEEEAFDVHFQPQLDIERDTLSGTEALVRWRHQDFGLVAPSRFLPVAEESGLIVQIDRIVMQKAFAQFAKWKSAGLIKGRLSLNLAMKQLLQEDFLVFLDEKMAQFGFKDEWLEFEVTESDIMQNPQYSIDVLHRLHKRGISIAMDDFGTGYSSLAYLAKLPLDKLKIDRSFIVEMPKQKSATEIVKVVIALAQTLGLDLVAEGVEEYIQKDYLYNMGCKKIQGYLYSKPFAAEEYETYLKKLRVT